MIKVSIRLSEEAEEEEEPANTTEEEEAGAAGEGAAKEPSETESAGLSDIDPFLILYRLSEL